jgi:[CysO sulfur-carrier protein]-S-L-cysteine hydrolase
VTLRIPQVMVDAILQQALDCDPEESCGVILGPIGKDQPTRLKPMVNSAHSPVFYEFDSKELLALYREIEDNDEEIVVIYHSHPTSEAHPSNTDIAYAGEPGAHYVLSSHREELAGKPEFRSFRIVNGLVTEENIVII